MRYLYLRYTNHGAWASVPGCTPPHPGNAPKASLISYPSSTHTSLHIRKQPALPLPRPSPLQHSLFHCPPNPSQPACPQNSHPQHSHILYRGTPPTSPQREPPTKLPKYAS